jgi:hypothetical protein
MAIIRTKEVQQNLEETFGMAPDDTETTEKQSILPVEKKKRAPYTKKAPTRGGARKGSGRPKGSTNKITPVDMLDDFKQRAGMNFHEFINEQIVAAHLAGDRDLVSKYLLGFAKYLVQDVQEVDITSKGESLSIGFNFPNVELKDWKDA